MLPAGANESGREKQNRKEGVRLWSNRILDHRQFLVTCKSKLSESLFSSMRRGVEKMGTISRTGCGQRQFSTVRRYCLELQLPPQSTRTRFRDRKKGIGFRIIPRVQQCHIGRLPASP